MQISVLHAVHRRGARALEPEGIDWEPERDAELLADRDGVLHRRSVLERVARDVDAARQK